MKSSTHRPAGHIAAVLVSRDPLAVRDGFATSPLPGIGVDHGGIPGSRHHGPLRLSGPREPWLKRGLSLRNDRQLSALSLEEMDILAMSLGLPQVDPSLLGANLLVLGLTDFSRIAPGSHLAIGGVPPPAQAKTVPFSGGAVLRVEAYNTPCRKAGRMLASAFGQPEIEFDFVRKAAGLRGLVLSVAMSGTIREGDSILVIPPILPPMSRPVAVT